MVFTKRVLLLLTVWCTVIVTKLVLLFLWNLPIMISQRSDQWHHMYTGILLMIASFILPKRFSIYVLGIGLGLFLDEVVHLFHMLGITGSVPYWSWESILTTLFTLIIVSILILNPWKVLLLRNKNSIH